MDDFEKYLLFLGTSDTYVCHPDTLSLLDSLSVCFLSSIVFLNIKYR